MSFYKKKLFLCDYYGLLTQYITLVTNKLVQQKQSS
jgi:hypothetical protein